MTYFHRIHHFKTIAILQCIRRHFPVLRRYLVAKEKNDPTTMHKIELRPSIPMPGIEPGHPDPKPSVLTTRQHGIETKFCKRGYKNIKKKV